MSETPKNGNEFEPDFKLSIDGYVDDSEQERQQEALERLLEDPDLRKTLLQSENQP